MVTAVAEKKHAVLGPSGWDTWGTCPGSVPLGEDMPNTSSEYARLGTAAHQLLDDCLTNGLDAEDLLGREYEVEGSIYVVDMDMAEAVDAALNYVRDTLRSERGDVLMAEQSVPLQHLTGEQDAEGTSDVVGIADDGKLLVVMDYKHGQGVKVWASTKDGDPNGQMAMYGLGTLHKYRMLYEDIERVKLVILQPRQEHIDEHEMTVEELLAFGDKVVEAAGRVELARQAATLGDDLDLVPSEKGCKFCKAKVRCPAIKQLMVAQMAPASTADDFDDLTLPKKASSLGNIGDLSPEQLAEIHRAAPLIEDYLKAIRAEVERRLFDGQTVPGLYIGEGKKGNRKWQDEDEALKQLTKSGRLKVADATVAKVISPTQAEKKLKNRPKIWAQIAPLITQTEGQPSVCREGVDTNPVYQIASPVEAFDDLTAPPSDVVDLMAE